ncbi:MAG: hypothetical protein AAGC90_06580 [Curtobacterium sp.]
MSPSDAQPPLSRRQARERERAANAGAQPVTPPPTVASEPVSSGTAFSDTPTSADAGRRRPGSHVAPAAAAPVQAPSSSAVPPRASAGVPSPPPASATEIVPGTGGLTRRQIRQMRAAEGQGVRPVPLQNPTPQSSDRTVQDVIGTVGSLSPDERAAAPTAPSGFAGSHAPVTSATDDEPGAVPESSGPTQLDPAAVEQATSADGSPDDLEPLDEAAAHAEEPRRHRSTWAPQADADDLPEAQPVDDIVAPADEQPAASAPGVFPLSLDADDDDTNEVPIQSPEAQDGSTSQDEPTPAPAGPAFRRPVEPKPVTTAFEAPTGHWSTQAHDSHDAEVHDEETGTRRVAETRTNALILPNSALADPTGALNATGEVILTGSIDLPASLSSTGSHRPIDGAEVDRLLDQHDEQPETDASPVRASRAVSSHTSTRQVVLAAAKPKESRTPLILGITVSAVGVAAAAVIIVALVTTNFFGS